MKINLIYQNNQTLADKINNELEKFAVNQLFHIDVYGLSKKLGLKKEEVLDVFIKGVYDGIFTIDWIYHCPTCGSAAHETLFLHEASSENFCPACNKSFLNTLDDNIEIFFSIHPNIQTLDSSLKTAYIKEIEGNVNSGNYLTWIKPNVIRGVDIIQNNLYRELMGSDVLSLNQSLQIMKAVILFTDIKGSTNMYEQLGDAKAFSLVSEHFRILFDVIKEYDGVPIKTIGDAVMGVFINPQKAAAASFEAQKQLISHYGDKDENEKIEVKIGLHTGPSIVVTLNNRLDYFGSTVNIAARIQAVALPNEVVISQELFDDVKIKRLISSVTKTVQRQTIKFKGLSENRLIYHIRLN